MRGVRLNGLWMRRSRERLAVVTIAQAHKRPRTPAKRHIPQTSQQILQQADAGKGGRQMDGISTASVANAHILRRRARRPSVMLTMR